MSSPAELAPAVQDGHAAAHHSKLEEFEREHNPRYPFMLSYREVKLLGIAGVRPSIVVVTRPVFMSSL